MAKKTGLGGGHRGRECCRKCGFCAPPPRLPVFLWGTTTGAPQTFLGAGWPPPSPASPLPGLPGSLCAQLLQGAPHPYPSPIGKSREQASVVNPALFIRKGVNRVAPTGVAPSPPTRPPHPHRPLGCSASQGAASRGLDSRVSRTLAAPHPSSLIDLLHLRKRKL